ncbi:HAD family hydrolase [Frankia sp. CNm7]|uniref:HAD family hydrolase n=1 Tax=Frankia nepalensis TaxID=1836974 RepID=A0A937RRT0_9ACTN|nr:HAD family hydrolase [Frankia nepalensis]MBL7509552.1 HAD family hydrolase [Frankia nepalensis]MBL7524072.1 HAD family hydrolase [Frankia nepalensis]MBL7632184.1 HAD family hydrolase [Frankia nepalensis]
MIFDLDGTLFDHESSAVAALRQWVPRLGVETVTDVLLAAWFEAEDRHFGAWQNGLISYVEQRRARLRDFLPHVGHRPGTDAELDRHIADYLTCYASTWQRFDDVDAALTAVARAGLATAVLTNGIDQQQFAKVEAIGLAGRVGPVFTAEAIGVAKPAPITYLTVCERLGVPAEAVLHVGDRHDLDVLAPRAVGLNAVHLDRTGRGPLDEPHRITSLAELGRFLPPAAVGSAAS